MTLIVALEGMDGVGKTSHTRALCAALCASGVDARAWHHPHPPITTFATPWLLGLWYATQRALWVSQLPDVSPAVYVVDRWVWSSWTSSDEDLRALAHVESGCLPDVHTVLLTAPPHVIAARIEARGEPPSADGEAVAKRYSDLAVFGWWQEVDTDRDPREVTADLVRIAQVWL